jgi:glycosyltransferase involved in cell wall biosynthesis
MLLTVIPPVTPEVSFVLLTYNQSATAVDALLCVLNQDYPNLEIVVSDDCSSDDTFDRLEAVCSGYEGPHRLRLTRTDANIGILGNLTQALSAASGGLAVLAAGDDLSYPTRASELSRAWVDAGMPRSAVVYSDVRPIDKDGDLVAGWPERIVRPPWTLWRLAEAGAGPLGAACGITPNLVTEPQSIDPAVRHEDRVFPFRAALLGGPVLFVDKPLLDYRVEGGISRRKITSRWHYLTDFMAEYIARLLPDARQRLSDAKATNAPARVISRCEQVLAEQTAFLEMADGRALIDKSIRAVSAGARPMVIGKHLLRFLRALLDRA